MFDEINGLPVHALVVHGAVVLVPLAGLLGVLFATPRTRQWARVPLAIVAVASMGTVFVAKESGEKLSAVLGTNLGTADPVAKLVREHSERAELLFIFNIIFAVLAVAALVLSRSPEKFHGAVPVVLSVLLVLGAGALVFQTFRVGDLGSEAVWNPTGDQDYDLSDGA